MLIILFSCDQPFSFSVYDAKISAKYNDLTRTNLDRIYDLPPSGCFKVAVLSDVHYYYDELQAALQRIAHDDSVLFTVVAGDITDQGLLKEFILFQDIMKRFHKPYLTVIGNHDYLSNGALIYRQMFGEVNYSFVFNNVKFILFDDIFWESNKVPDFAWLASELEQSEKYDLVIPIAHIAPQDDQFPAEYTNRYHQLMVSHHVSLSLHGHTHKFSNDEPFRDGVRYITAPSVLRETYLELTISGTSIKMKEIRY